MIRILSLMVFSPDQVFRWIGSFGFHSVSWFSKNIRSHFLGLDWFFRILVLLSYTGAEKGWLVKWRIIFEIKFKSFIFSRLKLNIYF